MTIQLLGKDDANAEDPEVQRDQGGHPVRSTVIEGLGAPSLELT